MNTKVETKFGTVEGFKEEGLNKWLGIAFAKPPVGELRFRRAVESDKWVGIKDCKQYGKKPIQFGNIDSMNIPESEDCLNLNIWRPDNGKENLPVFVWIYGGGFTSGENSDPAYDGSSFAKEDVLYVAINYRVGVLGFYDLTIYDRENFDSNCGLSDQIMGLKWIKENIEAFGGDPDNITNAGESAGGASVCNLLAAPTAKGLFHKAISQSGLPECVHTKGSTKRLMDLFLEEMKLAPHEVDQLRYMNPEDMKKAAQHVQDNSAEIYPGIFQPGPVIDDLLPEGSVSATANGETNGVKLIIGTNHDEGSLFIKTKWTPYTWELVEKMLKLNNCEDKLPELKALYQHEQGENEQLSMFGKDRLFLTGALKVADGQSKHNDVWMYRFDYAPVILRAQGLNAMHACEIPVALGTMKEKSTLANIWMGTPEEMIKKLTHEMHTAWLNFAKHGDPNGHLGFEWNKYNAETRATLIFDEDTHMTNHPDKANFEVWKDLKFYQD